MTQPYNHPEKIFKDLEWTDNLISRYWDFLSRRPEDYFTYRYGDNIVDTFLPFLKPASRVLDYGSGPGHLIGPLLDKAVSLALEVYATDTSSESLHALNLRFATRPGFCAADQPSALLQSGITFDAVFIVETIEHCTDAQLALMMETVRKLLKPGGLLFITTPNDEDLERSKIYCPLCQHSFHRWQHIRSWNKQSLSEMLRSLSYKIIVIDGTHFGKRQHGLKSCFRRLRNRASSNHRNPHLYVVAKN